MEHDSSFSAAAVESLMVSEGDSIKEFLRQICAVPSIDGQIKDVAQRVEHELHRLGYQDVQYDGMGCLRSHLGSGPRKILYDAHLDTVGIGDPSDWAWDPFTGKLDGQTLYARGACDTKGSVAGMVYGLAFAHRLGWLDGIEAIFFGSLEEQCDGLAPRYLVEQEHITPDYVVIGEPTQLDLYLGQRGRVEMELTVRGRAAHAATPELGVNPLYIMARVLQRIEQLNLSLNESHSTISTGSIAATNIGCKTASVNAVPSECSIILDRRLALDETAEIAKAELHACFDQDPGIETQLDTLLYDEPSYTGLVFPVEKYFPAWYLTADHPFAMLARQAYQVAYGKEPIPGTWVASTNGTYWSGVADIPSVGFGPGDLQFAHRTDEHVDLDEVVRSTAFYAILPAMLHNYGSA